MQSFEINWAFLLEYDKDSGSLHVNFSNQFMEDNELKNTNISLLNHEICTFLHRYDYRKLNYFCQTEMKEIFDTLMRFTIKKSKHPLRTIAICKLNDHGMSCINFEESKIVNLQNYKLLNRASKSKKRVDIMNSSDLSQDKQTILGTITTHLSKIMERNREMV